MHALIDLALQDRDWSESIGRSARARVLRDHTVENRVGWLEWMLGHRADGSDIFQ